MARFSFLAPIAAVLLLAGPAAADEAPLWSSTDNWQIRYDSGYRGCFIVASYTRGTVLRMGFNANADAAYLWIGMSDWNGLQVGQQYPLEFQFDNSRRWHGMATAIRQGNTIFLEVPFDDVHFFQDIVHRHWVTFYYQGQEVTSLTLQGSHEAIDAMVECQRAHGWR